MNAKMLSILLVLGIVCVVISQAQAGIVPGGDFAMYKPGTGYTVTAIFDPAGNNYAQGVGDNLAVLGDGIALYSDGTSGGFVDLPGWVGPVGGTNNIDLWSTGVAEDGTTCMNAFGTWSGGNGDLIESADPLTLPTLGSGEAYAISVMVDGAAGPLTFDLMVDGVVVSPSTDVTPALPTSGWQEMSRTYNSIPAGDAKILIGIDALGADLFGTRTRLDNVSIGVVPATYFVADYALGSLGAGQTDRTSRDNEPLTTALAVTGGDDDAGTAGGISLSGDDFNASTTEEAFGVGDFLEFTIELDRATSMSMQDLSFSIDLDSIESINYYALRSSADSFAADIGSGDFFSLTLPGSTTETIDLRSVADFQDRTSDVTFRLAFAGGDMDIGFGNGALLTSIKVTGDAEGDIGTPGDFDDDGDVDGADFLLWQRGESPNGGSPEDLATWKANYGTTGPGAASASAVPEPASLTLVGLGSLLLLLRRRV